MNAGYFTRTYAVWRTTTTEGPYGEPTFATPAATDIAEGDEVRFDGRALELKAVSVTSSGARIEALCEEHR